jgi:hypothetical protein
LATFGTASQRFSGSAEMTAPTVPDGVRNFVAEQISSIEQLEVLLFLRVHAARGWTAGQVSRELRGSPVSVTRRLGDLRDRGFLRTVEGVQEALYVYSPRTPELADAVSNLASTYALRPHAIIRLIFARPRAT